MRGIIVIVLVIASVVDARETPEYVKDLRRVFNDEYTGAYYRTLKSPEDLESTSKSVFDYFIKSHKSYSHEPGAYLAEWKKVYSNNGPFNSDEKIDELFDKLKNPDHFLTALQMEMLLDNRDNAKQAAELFKKVFASRNNIKVEQFYLGDDDIMHGVLTAAVVNNQNIAVFLVMLVD